MQIIAVESADKISDSFSVLQPKAVGISLSRLYRRVVNKRFVILHIVALKIFLAKRVKLRNLIV